MSVFLFVSYFDWTFRFLCCYYVAIVVSHYNWEPEFSVTYYTTTLI